MSGKTDVREQDSGKLHAIIGWSVLSSYTPGWGYRETIAREQKSGNLLVLWVGRVNATKKYTTLEMMRGPFRGSRD